MKELILASNSPRRKEILASLGYSFKTIPARIDETIPTGTKTQDISEYLSIKKAKAVLSQYPEDIVIGSDTIVVKDGRILGKPKNEAEAKEMLMLLSGSKHQVYTGLCVCNKERCDSLCVKSDVTFFELSNETINSYISTKEPMDKAGAYGIQGLGRVLVKEINGDFFSVMGFPSAQVVRLLKKYGIFGLIKV